MKRFNADRPGCDIGMTARAEVAFSEFHGRYHESLNVLFNLQEQNKMSRMTPVAVEEKLSQDAPQLCAATDRLRTVLTKLDGRRIHWIETEQSMNDYTVRYPSGGKGELVIPSDRRTEYLGWSAVAFSGVVVDSRVGVQPRNAFGVYFEIDHQLEPSGTVMHDIAYMFEISVDLVPDPSTDE